MTHAPADSPEALRSILREQITEYDREAGHCDALGRPDAARASRHRAQILAAYLGPDNPQSNS